MTISCKIEDDHWVLHVVDRGRGITSEDVRRIDAHTQFMRKTYEQQSSGLGLAIASRLAERYRGDLHINSRLNAGTDIYVRLPILVHR